MTYYNSKIYNKQNLKEKDLHELEYWNSVFTNVIETTDLGIECPSDTLNSIIVEFQKDFVKELKTSLALTMQEHVISYIENYDEDVEEIEEYETFLDEEE